MTPGPTLAEPYGWLAKVLDFIPMFTLYPSSPTFETDRSLFASGIVLVIMVLPVIVTTTRGIFIRTPQGHIKTSFVLGATRWETVGLTILPFNRSGFISGSMPDLGHALGEAMVLYLVASPPLAFRGSLLGGGTVFAVITANTTPEFNDNPKAGVYMSVGLVLFLLTFVISSIA